MNGNFFSEVIKQIMDTWVPKSSLLYKIHLKYKSYNKEQRTKIMAVFIFIEIAFLMILAKVFGFTSIKNGLFGSISFLTYLCFLIMNFAFFVYLAKKKGKTGVRGIMPYTHREVAESTEYGSAIMMNYDDEVREKFTVTSIEDSVEQIYGQIPDTKSGSNVVSEKKMADGTVEECNILGIGKAGTGKTSTIGLPNIYQCIKRGESFACIDPKAAEIRQESICIARDLNGYKAYTLNVLDPEYCDGWDFLAEVIDRTKRKGRLDPTRLDMFVNVYFPNTAGVGGEQAYYVEGAAAYLKLLISVLTWEREQYFENNYISLYKKLIKLGIKDSDPRTLEKQVDSLDDFKNKVKDMICEVGAISKDVESSFNSIVEAIEKTAPTATIDDVHFWQAYESLIIQQVVTTPNSHPARQALKTIADTIQKVPNGWVGFKQNLATRLSMFNNESLRMAMSTPKINLRTINKEKTALYIVCKDGDSTFRAILSLFFAFMMMDIKEEYDQEEQKTKEIGKENPSLPVYMFLDEMYSVGAIGGLPSKKGEATFLASQISTIRSRKINMTMLFQSHSQLEEIYGKEAAHTIKMNTNCKMFLGGTETDTTNYFSDLLGDTTVLTESHTETNMVFGTVKSDTLNVHTVKSKLMTPEEIGHLPKRSILLCHGVDNPIILNTFYYKLHPMYREDLRVNLKNDIVPLNERIEKGEINQSIYYSYTKPEEPLTVFTNLEKSINNIAKLINEISLPEQSVATLFDVDMVKENVDDMPTEQIPIIKEDKNPSAYTSETYFSDEDIEEFLKSMQIEKDKDVMEEFTLNESDLIENDVQSEEEITEIIEMDEKLEQKKTKADQELDDYINRNIQPATQQTLFPQDAELEKTVKRRPNKKGKKNKKEIERDIDI